ncbi:MAG TPA: cation-efflux pump [Halobacteria archaeon]|nr:cation-efflux pump [Halobacteria archaeon]
MRSISAEIARRAAERYSSDDKRLSYFSSIINIIVNSVLFLLKIITGILIGSMALIGDGIDTFFDVVIAVIMLVGFVVAFSPPDKEHPFGHGRFEDISTIILSIILILSGTLLAYESISRLFTHFVISVELWVILVVIFNVILKSFLVRFSYAINKELKSETVEANAFNYLGDVLNSLIVLVSLVVYYFTGFEHIDSIAGTFIGAMITIVGVRFLRSSSSEIMGEACNDEDIRYLILSTDGVEGVHDVYKHSYGRRCVICMHLEVKKGLSIDQAHAITEEVERKISRQYNDVDSTVIHVEPIHTDQDEGMEAKIVDIIRKHPEIKSFHKIRAAEDGMIVFHIQVDRSMRVEKAHKLVHELKREISYFFPGDVEVHVEPYKRIK